MVKEVKINFGETQVEHNNIIVGFVIQQILEFGFVIIENSVYFVGGYIFSNMLGPVLDKVFDDYKLDVRLPSPLAGQDTSAKFTFDYRNVRSPFIGDGYMEMYLFGEFLHGSEACELDADYMDFINSEKFSQLVVSESAMTCILNNFAASPIGKVELDSHRMDQLFSQSGLKFDTTLLKDYIPVLYKKVGKDVDLTLVLEFEKIKTIFGQYDSDVIVEYELIFTFVNKASNEVILKDRFPMISVLDIDTDHDIVYYRLLNHKIDNENSAPKSKSEIDNIGLTATQYREFMSQFSYSLGELKNWLNDKVFKGGLMMPYIVNEFLTNIYFKEKSMHVELEVFAGAVNFFEQKYDTWDY
uniref:Uncharacterized protein n=2 Tax=Strombidium inclinatum TaxID=197538 RepID=A0A7S3IHA3_9SPIT|mmetsp:Transcript_17024/g.26293  ORF Transcript_17024/g.26293 Transcript_17024/m.26293 type:complete len:356 (+) Transcript_17024:573-1640(+)